MKILFVSVAPLQKELGASKVVIEVGEEMERIGWECTWVSMPELLGGGPQGRNVSPLESAEALRAYLKTRAGAYDVVDYGLGYLPFPRSEFSPTTLLVGRSVLLIHHFLEIKLPTYRTWKARAHELLYGRRNRRELLEITARVNASIPETDLVNVANDDDKRALVRAGAPADKIVVLPYGLGRQRVDLFERTSTSRPQIPTVAFVGTFDSRKGATDFPALVKRIAAAVPGVRFLLLGTYKGRDEVLARFPQSVRQAIEVVPSYPADTLPELLASCSIGVFPSYVEAFGFGVLEMLAAGLPVIAYDAPGPPVMLPAQYLVPIGDTAAMADKVSALLQDSTAWSAARLWARERAKAFHWKDIARQTSEIYLERWRQRQSSH